MKHVFYFLGAILMVRCFLMLLNPKRRVSRDAEKLKIYGDAKGKELSDLPDGFIGNLLIDVFFIGISLTWAFGGLFTFNWVLFAAYLLLNFTVILELRKLFYKGLSDNGKAVWTWFTALISFVIYGFIIINAYHLKIDFQQILFSLF